MARATNEFIHFDGVTFARSHIIAISGPSVEMDEKGQPKVQPPFFTVQLTHGIAWRFTAPNEAALFDKRAALINLLA